MSNYSTCPICGKLHHDDRWCRPKMTYDQATCIIWVPDMYELGEVATAAEAVLAQRGAKFSDRWQASYLLSTFRRLPKYQQYVHISSTGE